MSYCKIVVPRSWATLTAPIVGGQDQDKVMVMYYSELLLGILNGIRSAPVADNSDRPDCGRSRPRQGHVHVFER